MKAKKLLCGALAAAMALSMSVTAFAEGEDGGESSGTTIDAPEGNGQATTSGSVKITGTTQTPTVKVSVPTSGSVILNPYKLTVTVSAKEGEDPVTSTEQIISSTQYIMNRSNMAIRVSASVTGAVAGNLKFATSSIAEAETAPKTNSAYVKFEMIGADDTTSDVTWDNAATAVLKVGAVPVKCADDADQTTKDKATLMGAATLNTQGEVTALGDNPYIAFHLTGDAVDAPTTAWAAADKVSATVAFSFSPEVVASASEDGGDST